MSDPATRLKEARKQATLAREQLDRDDPAWNYAQQTAATAESALVCIEGLQVLDESALQEPMVDGGTDER